MYMNLFAIVFKFCVARKSARLTDTKKYIYKTTTTTAAYEIFCNGCAIFYVNENKTHL